MPTFAFYLLKVMLCSVVLFGYYQLFLKNKVYHAYNRFYLLATVLIAMLAPLINFNMLLTTNEQVAKPIQLLQVVNSSDEYLQELIIYSHRNNISGSEIISLLYLLVSVVLLGMLIKTLAVIVKILQTSASRKIKEIVFVESDAKGTPFSFFRFIFWNRAIDVQSTTGKQIFAHELAHVREKHSIDKLFINIALIICWINPIFWLIKKELNLIHEFIADKKAVAGNDAAALAAMIVTSAYPQHSYLLTNHFFYSPIKRRLQMLSKYNSKTAGYFYRILALPLILLLIAAFTVKTKEGIEKLMNPAKKITVVIDAGHGGQDNGAQGRDGSFEKDLNLAFAKRIKELNQVPNINLVFTRETDIYQTPQEKAAFAKNAGADLFISIHTSSEPFATATKTGMEVFVSRNEYANSQASKLFASAVINHFQKNYGLNVTTAPIQGKTGILILQENPFPSIIIETGYLSNESDLAYLHSAKAKEDFAKNILEAIAQYADNMDKQWQKSSLSEPLRDTAPAQAIDLGNYKGEKIKSVSISKDCEVVDIKLANGQMISMSINEAKKQRVLITTAIKEDVPVLASLNSIDINKNIDASQRVTINVENDFTTSAGNVNLRLNENTDIKVSPDNINLVQNENTDKQPLIFLDGKEIAKEEMNNISPGSIESINVLKGESATKIYQDTRSVNGVILITSKKGVAKRNNIVDIKLSEKRVDTTDDRVSFKVFNKLEQEAEFPGGMEAWISFLKEHLKALMPVKEGWKNGTYTLIVRFIVKEDGSVTDVVAENYQGSKTAQMCIDLIKNGPKWIPGKQNGKVVNSYRKQPITFVVQQ